MVSTARLVHSADSGEQRPDRKLHSCPPLHVTGRVAMLGVTGWLVPELFTWPSAYFKPLDPVAAHDYMVSTGGMGQILLFILFAEVFGAIALRETIDGDRPPGYFGLDVFGLTKTPEGMKKYAEKEIKNGRLAMIAFGGLYHAFLVSHQGTFEQLAGFKGIAANVAGWSLF